MLNYNRFLISLKKIGTEIVIKILLFTIIFKHALVQHFCGELLTNLMLLFLLQPQINQNFIWDMQQLTEICQAVLLLSLMCLKLNSSLLQDGLTKIVPLKMQCLNQLFLNHQEQSLLLIQKQENLYKPKKPLCLMNLWTKLFGESKINMNA